MHYDASEGQRDCSAKWVHETTLFQRSQELRAEVDRHKWLESEKLGYDVGWDRALASWLVRQGRGSSS